MLDYKGLTFVEAFNMQLEMRKQLRFDVPDDQLIKTIAGADISYNKGSNEMFGIIVVLSYPELKPLAYSAISFASDFPYKPGYLGFKEIPTLLRAWYQIPEKPNVVVLDGQGILHPRRMGVASHFGVITKAATIGCAKNSLYGQFELPTNDRFSTTNVFDQNEHIGYALRTKYKNKPVYISPGFGITLENSLNVIKRCIGNYRIPEPTRQAHNFVNEFRLGKLKTGYHPIQQNLELF